jgi:hypothetical protein
VTTVTRTEDPRSASPRRRAATVLGALAVMALSFPIFWNFPGNDAHGEGPGHVLAHVSWALVLLSLATWLWRQRHTFTGARGPRLAVIALFVAAGAQVLESSGAAVVWATGKHADGNFALHDAVAAGGNTVAMLILAVGLVVWAASGIGRLRTSRRRWLVVALVGAGIAFTGLVACGGDEGDSDKQAYCEIERQIDDIVGEEIGRTGQSPTVEQMGAASVTAAQRIVEGGLLEEAVRRAPDKIVKDVDVLQTAVRLAAGGDPAILFSDATNAANERVDRYCGFANG